MSTRGNPPLPAAGVDSDYVKMSSQWTRRLDELSEQNHQLRLSLTDLAKEKADLLLKLESIEQRARTLEAERDLAKRMVVSRERQQKTVAEEHLLELQELQERIAFLERKLETMETGRELQERIVYLEQELVSRETEVRLLRQRERKGEELSTHTEQPVTLNREDRETEMQRLLLEKTELEKYLNNARCEGVMKDREISRLSRSLEEMDKELDLMKNLLQSTPSPASSHSYSSPSRNNSVSKRLSKRLSWFSERIGGSKLDRLVTQAGSIDSQPVQSAKSSRRSTKVQMRQARSLDALDVNLPPLQTAVKIQWSKKSTSKAPTNRIVRGAAVVHDKVVYFGSHLNSTIWGYNSTQEHWFALPDCPTMFFALAIVDGCLTAIGGQRSQGGPEATNEILSLVAGDHQMWVELSCPMPTKRTNAAAVTTNQVLVVAGGANSKKLDCVEVMNLVSKEWSVAMSLPRPVESMSSSYCPTTGRIFLMGGEEDGGPMKKALFCSVDELVHSCAHFNRIQDSSEVWGETEEVAVNYPTCLVVGERLLALGGIERERQEDSRAVYDYDSNTKDWRPLSLLPSPTHKLLAAALPGNRIMVLGGFTKVNISDNVYFASILYE